MRWLSVWVTVLSPFWAMGVFAEPFAERDGLVVMEAESTGSELGKWEARAEIAGFSGKGYLVFTGNRPSNGPADSPLAYRFKITRPGLYFLHLHAGRPDRGQRKDFSNDCYVRVAGDFEAGPEPGEAHGDHAPLKALQRDTKFYGGGLDRFAWASGNRLDLGGHRNKRVAVYRFKAGQTYTLTVSGRSQNFCLDRVVFRHAEVPKERAEDPEQPETMAADRKP